MALRDHLQATLYDLIKKEVLAPVTKPMACVNSMVVVPKKIKKSALCSKFSY